MTGWGRIGAGALALGLLATAAPAQEAVRYAWVQYDFDGRPAVRAVVDAGAACPDLLHDAGRSPLTLRTATPPPGFEAVHVCEGLLPLTARAPRLGGLALPEPSAAPSRIVVIGDTGCRSKGKSIQNCNGDGQGPRWNYAGIAAQAAAQAPDLVIHVGDYHYRESDCHGACDPATVGFTWQSWEADFLKPSGALLTAAPWIHTRGNHEDCARAFKGWFYLLDPRPYPTAPLPQVTRDAQGNQTCSGWNDADTTPTMSSWIFTDPYAVSFADRRIVVMDTSYIHDDYEKPPEPAAVRRYADQFEKVEALADAVGAPAWLITHRPFWAVASYLSGGQPQAGATDATLQAAIEIHGEGRLAASVDLLLAGHIHLFEALRFRDSRPPQLVFGNSGTQRDPELQQGAALPARTLDALRGIGAEPEDFLWLHDFDFGVISPAPDGLTVQVHDIDAAVIGRLTIPQ